MYECINIVKTISSSLTYLKHVFAYINLLNTIMKSCKFIQKQSSHTPKLCTNTSFSCYIIHLYIVFVRPIETKDNFTNLATFEGALMPLKN